MRNNIIAAVVLVAYAAVGVLLKLDPFDALVVLLAFYALRDRLDKNDRKGLE